MRLFLSLCSIILLSISSPVLAKTITFSSEDGLQITADLKQGRSNTAIVLFHQARSSRGEYTSIAPRLNKLGYTTLAVDQRSGDRFGNVENQTAKAARAVGKPVNFTDALPDLKAAIHYVHNLPRIEKVIIWGSSYSASLSLVIAGQGMPHVDGVLSFSPGEYFSNLSVRQAAKTITVPTFITSARSEEKRWRPIFEAIAGSSDKIGFVPEGRGAHGSSALIKERSKNRQEYWSAIETFLGENF